MKQQFILKSHICVFHPEETPWGTIGEEAENSPLCFITSMQRTPPDGWNQCIKLETECTLISDSIKKTNPF